ncbi:biotinidase-like [Centruroides vittatus]|uniref:biotinidase-like n=1 Tax=Centruroides vittatus TaxID=120091 RepID=UPI00350F4299
MYVEIFKITLLLDILVVKAINYYYTAAVFEYHTESYEKDPILVTAFKNLLVYRKVTLLAALNEADIIVFPEYGLYPFVSREKFKIVAQDIPDPKYVHWNPCVNSLNYQNVSIAKELSCMARQSNIYLVANIISVVSCKSESHCPSDNIFLYNTNVVFDRRGYLVARYHKFHAYKETGIDKPRKPEFVIFKTEFGTFGTFICYDLNWIQAVELLQKFKIDTIVYTAWWGGELPSLISIQRYFSWAARFNVNMLASNRNIPSTGTTGSGIFRGASSDSYIYNPNGKNRLILAKVARRGTKIPVNDTFKIFEFGSNHSGNNLSSGICSIKILGPPKNEFDYRCDEEDLSGYTLMKLHKIIGSITACNNGLCCKLAYKITNFHKEEYYLAVRNDTFKLEGTPVCVETCMMVRCDSYGGKRCSVFPTAAKTVFEEVSMKANFSTVYIYPNILTSGVQLLNLSQWHFNDNSILLKNTTDKPLLTVSLFGRCYSRDLPNQYKVHFNKATYKYK